MGVTHDVDIDIIVNLSALPAVVAGYHVLLLLDEAAGNTLDGDRVRTYSTPSEVNADVAASFLSTAAGNQLIAALSQRPRADYVYAGRVDTAGGETYVTGLDACLLITGEDAYLICMDSQTAADQVALAASIEARELLLCIQSADPDWLTTGLPAAYTSLDGLERTFVIYQDTATSYCDVAWAAKFLAVDPDQRASTPLVPLRGVTAVAANLTAGQRNAAIGNNASLPLPLGPSPVYISRSTNSAGRPVEEILTADWFTRRARAAIAQTAVAYGDRNERWPVTREGAGVLQSQVQAILDAGVNAGHFVAGQIESQAITPDQSDIDNQRLRCVARAQVGIAARQFVVTADFSASPITDA